MKWLLRPRMLLSVGLGLFPMALPGQPVNDHFTERIVIAGTNLTVLGSNTGATMEASEPARVFGLLTSRSVWWTWTAPARGVTYLTTQQSDVSGTAVSVYTGDSVTQLTWVHSAEGDGYWGFQAEAGVAYQIAVSSLSGLEGQVVLALHHLPPPPNDHFANRQMLVGAPLRFVSWNAGATHETGEPQHWVPAAGKSVWYSWTAPVSGRVTMQSSAYQNTPPQIAIYRGSTLQSLFRIAGSGDNDSVTFDVAGGTTYFVAIDRRYNEGSTFVCELKLSTITLSSPAAGSIIQAPTDVPVEAVTTSFDGELARVDFFSGEVLLASAASPPYRALWRSPPPGQHTIFARAVGVDGWTRDSPVVNVQVLPAWPTNDQFTNALFLSGDRNEFFVDNYHATLETGEPHTPFGLGHSLWWSWMSPFTGKMLVTAVQTSAPPVVVGPDPVGAFPCVGVYAGNSLGGLMQVTNWPNFKTTPLIFSVIEGMTYHFAWDSYIVTPESYLVTQAAYQNIPNDDYTNRSTLQGTNVLVSGTTQIATREPGESGGGEASVWYSWVAPDRGLLRPSVTGDTSGLTVSLFTGSSVTNLSVVPLVNAPEGGVETQVQPGQAYVVRVASPGGTASGAFQIALSFLPTPTNDHFTNAVVLTGLPVTTTGNTRLATSETNEPNHAQAYYGQSLWWRWTAPTSAKVAVHATGASSAPAFAVYTGNSLTALSPIGGSGFTYYPRVFNAVAGQTYRIAVATGAFGEDVRVHVFGVSSNDAFTNRIPLNGAFGITEGNNATASKQSGEPTISTNSIGRTVWYSWIAPESGALTLSAAGAFPPQVGVFMGISVSSLVRITNVFGGPSSAPDYGPYYAILPVTNGVTYHFAVDGTRLQDDGLSYDAFGQFTLTYNFTTLQIITPTNRAVFIEGTPIPLQITSPLAPLDGNVTDINLITTSLFRLPELHPLSNSAPSTVLSNFPPDFYSLAVVATNSDGRMLAAAPVSITVRPKNDRFADRVPLLGAMTSASGWISASSLETGEQSRWEQGIVGSVWWTWIAPASGRFAIVSDRSLRAFTGTSIPSLSLVASSPNGYISFNAVAGQTYQIGSGIRAADPSAPVYHVALRIYPSPANDQFVQRTPVVTNRASEPFYTYAATRQSGEPNHGAASGGGSVWFTWTAPSDGTMTLQLSNLNFAAVLGVYTGSVVNALTKITNSTSPSVPMRISARNGMAYHFAIDGNGGSVGGGVLNLHFLATPNDFFANRIQVAGEIVNLRGDNRDATREPGEPVLTGPGPQFAPQATLWWEWTAPRTGLISFASRGSEIRLAGVVWRGTELANLGAVYRLDLANGGMLSLPLQVQAGEIFPISIGGFGSERGELGLEIAYVPTPPNDDFEARRILSGTSLTVTGTVAGATVESTEPSTGRPSVWFAWTAPKRGRATVTVNADLITPGLVVYKGTNLNELTTLVTSSSTKTGFRAEAGREYQIGVYSIFLQDFSLSLDLIDSPTNDDLIDRAYLSGSSYAFPVLMWGSTSEAEGYMASDQDGDLWWNWTAPWSGTATIICPEASGITVNLGDTSVGSQVGVLGFQTSGGRSYLIRVQGSQQLQTTLSITLDSPQPVRTMVKTLEDGFRLELSGLPRQVVAIHASDDLVNWQPAHLHTFLGTSLHITEPLDQPRRFYRIVPLR